MREYLLGYGGMIRELIRFVRTGHVYFDFLLVSLSAVGLIDSACS